MQPRRSVQPPCSLPLIGEGLQPEIRMTALVPQHPNPDVFSVYVVQEVLRKAIEITAPQSAPIKMETPRVFGDLTDSDLKLREEVLPKLARNLIVFPQDFV